MNLKLRDCLVLVCFCMFGIQTGFSMVAEMRDVMNNCPREGGFCINTIPPQPPKKPITKKKTRNVRRRPVTRTRKGQRQKMSPRALGANNNVLPGRAKPAVPGIGAPPRYAAARMPVQQNRGLVQQASVQQPYVQQAHVQQAHVQQAHVQQAPVQQQQQQGYIDPFANFFNFGMTGTGTGTAGSSGGSSMDPFYSMMMFTRKKRQAAAAPPMFEPGEAPVRAAGQSMYGFLNMHCLKSEFDFGCRNTGGFCCVPHP